MQEKRQERLEREFRLLCIERKEIAMKVLRTFKISQIPSGEIMPEGPDFCNFQPIIDVLNRPREEEITESSFDAVVPLLPGLIARWREDIRKSLVTLIQKSHLQRFYQLPIYAGHLDDSNQRPPPLSDEDAAQTLNLATTVFECLEDRNHNTLFYPQVLGHTCLTRTKNRWPAIDDSLTRGVRRLVDHAVTLPNISNYDIDCYGITQYRCVWGARLILSDHARSVAEDLVRLAGLDPTTATVEDMDQLGLRFVCRTCANDCIASLFTWRAAVRFILTELLGCIDMLTTWAFGYHTPSL